MLRVSVHIGHDCIEVEGDVKLAEMGPLLEEFFGLSKINVQHLIDEAAARLKSAADDMDESLKDHTPVV